ncbi:hypothetical protein FB384_004870 [Prauserella sediminis]|uniref:Uncharacterized protein n=1 Tax=Prauserella sediminis TaxID=577680 RepID=A0A839XT77_9PSEU|nr:hypothetical protein [Prauserella sediminis]MBB3665911.1 hypothetical protein [Prauserella sediminis]
MIGEHLSHARRFVLVAGQHAVADGVVFLDGMTVVSSREHYGVTMFPDGVQTIPTSTGTEIHYVDPER